MVEEFDVIPVQSADFTDQQEGVTVGRVERDGVEGELGSAVGGFGELSLGGAGEIQGFLLLLLLAMAVERRTGKWRGL